MSKLFATLKSKLLCALALAFAACLTLGLSFSVPAHAEENLIKEYNLTLSNDLSVNFYAKETVGENAYLTASVEGIAGEKTIYANADNAYKFTVTDLAPQLMSRKITVKLYNAAKELKGTNEITLSDYCKALLDRGKAGNNMGEKEFKALSTLVVDLLNYGAAAQEYKNDTAAKCNAFLSETGYTDFVGGEYTMPAASAFTATVADEATKANVKPTTAKLYLDYNVVAKIAFEVKDLAVDGVKALVGGSEVTATVSSATATTEGVTTYTASIPLSVLDIEKEVSVTLLSGEKEVGYKVTGSVSGYLSTRAANTEATDKTLASKLYAYAKSAAEFENSGVVDIILFTGQSNMVGRDTQKYEQAIPEGMAYEYLMNSDELVEVKNPVGENIGGTTSNPTVEVSSGSSIVPAFVAKYVQETGRKVIVVHAARGAQAISYFVPGTKIYNVLLEKYTKAVSYVEKNTAYDIGKKFYVMFQGESDASVSGPPDVTVKNYKTDYLKFHNGVKEELGLEFGSMILTSKNTHDVPSGVLLINQAQTALAEEKDDIIVASTCATGFYDYNFDEYYLKDTVHYNAAGLQAIANEAATSVANYLGYGEADKKGVDPITYLKDCYPTYTLTLTGATFADGSTEKKVKVGALSRDILKGVVATGENADKEINSFINNYGKYVSFSEFIMPRADVTLTPATFDKAVATGNGNTDIGFYDYAGYAVQGYGMGIKRIDSVIIDGKYMRAYETTGVASGNDGTGTNASFRMFANYSTKTSQYIEYTFKNLGENEMNFDIYLRASGSDKEAVDAKTVIVPVGATASVTLLADKNRYGHLNYFRFTDNAKIYKFAVYAEAVAGPSFTATIDGGKFVSTGTNIAQVRFGEVIPEITWDDGKTAYALVLSGADGNSVSGKYGEVTMPEYDVTITPIHLSPVTSGSGDIDWAKGSYQTMWDPTAVVSFANKYVVKNNKLGTIYNVTGAENSQFRLMTEYYPLSGTEYTMTYTFANLGETDIAFTCYQVNSGNTLTNFKQEISIKAGESVTVAITFKFVGNTTHNGQICANANVMCFFVLGTGFENGSQLFVSSSIVQS